MRLEKRIVLKFIAAGKTLAVAESCTGGLVGHLVTNVAGASGFFWGGFIAYDNTAKTKILKVPPALLKKHGAVSAQVAGAMAKNARKILNTDYGLAITGIAGPSGGSSQKPVGLVFMALSQATKTITGKFQFKGTRQSIKLQAARAALELLEQSAISPQKPKRQ